MQYKEKDMNKDKEIKRIKKIFGAAVMVTSNKGNKDPPPKGVKELI